MKVIVEYEQQQQQQKEINTWENCKRKTVEQHSLFYKFDYLLEIICARPTIYEGNMVKTWVSKIVYIWYGCELHKTYQIENDTKSQRQRRALMNMNTKFMCEQLNINGKYRRCCCRCDCIRLALHVRQQLFASFFYLSLCYGIRQ